jgi:hypothetical protein
MGMENFQTVSEFLGQHRQVNKEGRQLIKATSKNLFFLTGFTEFTG